MQENTSKFCTVLPLNTIEGLSVVLARAQGCAPDAHEGSNVVVTVEEYSNASGIRDDETLLHRGLSLCLKPWPIVV